MIRMTAVLMMTALAAPALAESRIAFLAAERGDAFQDLIESEVTAAVRAQPGFSVTVSSADKDAGRQIAQGRTAIAEKAAALVVVAVNDDSATALAEAAGKAGTPLVFVNKRQKLGAGGAKAVIVSSNDLVAGRLQMRMLVEKIGGRGNVAILRGADTDVAAGQRTAGMKEILAERPQMTLVADESANWKRREAQEKVAAWLLAGRKIDVIAANNDEMALGAIAAIRAAGLSGRIFVGGVDATPDGVAAIASGDMLISVFQNARAQSYRAVTDATKLSQGAYVQQYDWVPFELVTAGNVKDYLPN